jgi:hypothetical protein
MCPITSVSIQFERPRCHVPPTHPFRRRPPAAPWVRRHPYLLLLLSTMVRCCPRPPSIIDDGHHRTSDNLPPLTQHHHHHCSAMRWCLAMLCHCRPPPPLVRRSSRHNHCTGPRPGQAGPARGDQSRIFPFI